MKLSERSIISALRQRHYKLTPQRRAVIDAILTSQDHLTPSAIYRKVCQRHRGIGLVTVYRTLDILKELGLVCELRTGDSCPSYTISNPKHHHHLICSGCGKVIDFISPDSFKHDIDTRDKDTVTTRDGGCVDAILVSSTQDIRDMLIPKLEKSDLNVSVIFLDECQFFTLDIIDLIKKAGLKYKRTSEIEK